MKKITFLFALMGLLGSPGIAQPVAADTGSPSCGSVGLYLLEQQAAQGDAGAKYYLGRKLFFEGCDRAARMRGLALMEALANAGHSGALFDLGIIVMHGAETAAEEAQGLSLIQQSARNGFAEAEAHYGLLLMASAQVATERDQAMYWLGSAADKGLSNAARAVSVLYMHGMHGVPADRCAASLWAEAADLIDTIETGDTARSALACR